MLKPFHISFLLIALFALSCKKDKKKEDPIKPVSLQEVLFSQWTAQKIMVESIGAGPEGEQEILGNAKDIKGAFTFSKNPDQIESDLNFVVDFYLLDENDKEIDLGSIPYTAFMNGALIQALASNSFDLEYEGFEQTVEVKSFSENSLVIKLSDTSEEDDFRFFFTLHLRK